MDQLAVIERQSRQLCSKALQPRVWQVSLACAIPATWILLVIINPSSTSVFSWLSTINYHIFLHFGLLLVEHYQLSYPETISMVAAMELVPDTCYFFALAAQTLLQRPANNLHPSHR